MDISKDTSSTNRSKQAKPSLKSRRADAVESVHSLMANLDAGKYILQDLEDRCRDVRAAHLSHAVRALIERAEDSAQVVLESISSRA